MKKICKTCKWWRKIGDNWGECTLAASSHGEPDEPTTKAFALDGECWSAVLWTQSTFGCVQWDAIPVPES